MNYRHHRNILIEKYKCIFVVLPKNACSSIKAGIIEELGMHKGPNFPEDIHDPEVYPYPYVYKSSLNDQYKDYLRFCIARNPWDRLVSCYKDKIRSPDVNRKGYKNGVALPLLKNSPLFYGGMSFESFVDVVCNIRDSFGEHHFTSQLYQITDASGNLLVNYIGRLETLGENLEEISQKTGFTIAQIPHYRKTKSNPYQEYYTDELVEKVSKRFAADIDFFKYEFDQNQELEKLGFVDEELSQKFSNSKCLVSILKEKNHYLNDLYSSASTRIVSLEEKIKVQHEKLNKIQGSIFWKITAPLRKLVSILGFNQNK